MVTVLRWAALIALFVCVYYDQWIGGLIAFIVCLFFAVNDVATHPKLAKEMFKEWRLGVVGAAFGTLVCWITGFIVVSAAKTPNANYIGPGLQWWNLPGTILGLLVFIGTVLYGRKRLKTARSQFSSDNITERLTR
jgi:hypothetical protein